MALCNYPSGLVYPGLPDRVTYDLATRPYVSWRASAPTRASRTLAPERESNLEDDDTILADPGHRPKMVLDAGFDMHGNSATPHPHPRPPTHPPTTTHHPPTHPTPPHPTPPHPRGVDSPKNGCIFPPEQRMACTDMRAAAQRAKLEMYLRKTVADSLPKKGSFFPTENRMRPFRDNRPSKSTRVTQQPFFGSVFATVCV